MRRLATPLVATAAVLAWWVGTTLTSKAAGPQVSLTCERMHIIYTVPHNCGGVSTPTSMWAPTAPIPVIFCQASKEGSINGTMTNINTAASGTPAKYNWRDNPPEQVERPTASIAVDDVCTFTTTIPMLLMPLKHSAGFNPSHHDSEKALNNQWNQTRQHKRQLPNQHFARFWNSLLCLREVITADVVGAFLFGRWTQRYYRRTRKRRNTRRRRRRVRRLLSFVPRVYRIFQEVWSRIRATSPTGHGTDQSERATTNPPAAHAEETLRATNDVVTGTATDGTDGRCAKLGDSSHLSRKASTATTASEETPHESAHPLASMPPLLEPSVAVPSGAVIEATSSELPPMVGSLRPYSPVRAEETIEPSPAVVRSRADASLNESSTSVSPLVELLLAACETSDKEIVPEAAVLTFVSFLVPATELTSESSNSSRHPPTETGSGQISISAESPSVGVTYDAAETAYRAGHVPAVDPSQRFRDEYFVQRYADKLGKAGCEYTPPSLPHRLVLCFPCCSLFVPLLSSCMCTIARRLDDTNFKIAYQAGHVPAVDPSQRFRDEYFVQRYADKLGKASCDSVGETERKRRIFHAGFVAGFGHD